MIQTVNKSMFMDAFKASRPDNFSYEGLSILFDALEDLGDSTGEPMELDVIAICCDFTEEEAVNIASNYDIDISEFDDSDNQEEEIYNTVLAYLEDNTFVCGSFNDSTIVYQNF